MNFDSHVFAVSRVAAGLVNSLTPGEQRGQAYEPPTGPEQRRLIAEVLVPEGPRPRVSPAQAARFRALADDLRAVFEDVAGGRIDAAATRVNALLDETGAKPRLDSHAGSGWSVHFHGHDDSLDVGWAAGCAAGLALALGSDFAGRLGVCEAPRCERVYVDQSRNSAKRFCSTGCQNRVKAAAFRSRRA